MKLHLTRIVMAVAISVFLSACTKTNVEGGGSGGDDELVEAVINAGIGGGNTRAHDTEWDENDAIGLAMLIDGGTEVINDVYNYHYVTSQRLGVFEPQTSEMMIYFPADGTHVSFRAYYPFYRGLDTQMNIPVDVSNQSTLPDIDFMSADHISGTSKRDPIVRLYFHHRFSKLIFKLSTDNDNQFPPLENATLTIRGMKTTGTYHLLQEELDVNEGSGRTLTFPVRENASERYGIVLPREAGEGVEFDFTFPDGSLYTAKMSENLDLLGGYQYTFYINLKETAATVSAEIAPWIDAPARYYDSVQASVDAGESVNVEAGTVMDVFVSEDNQEYSELAAFEYNADGKWYPETDVFWESIPYNPAYMRSSIVMADPLDATQTGDWLTSEVVTVPRNTGAKFVLSRAVSKAFITLNSDLYTEDELNSATITLPDYFTGGYLQDGEFIEGTDRGDILAVADSGTPTRAATSGTSVALFQPQSVSAGGTIVSISLNGRTYDVEAPSGGFSYQPGVAEQFIITIKEEKVTVSVTVVDWELGPLTSFDAVQVSEVAGESHNVTAGDKIDLYLYDGDVSWDYFSSYVFNADGKWYGSPVKYWEDLSGNPEHFIARMDAAPALNDTQLPDVLLSEATAGYRNEGIDFVLEHAATKVIVGLVSDSFTDEQKAAATITLPGYTVGGQFDGAKLISGGTTTGDITVARTDAISGVAIFEPQTIPEGQTAVRITYGSTTYEAKAPEGGLEFPAGVATTMLVSFEKGEISIGVTVVNWETRTVELKALQVIVEPGANKNVLDGDILNVYAGATRELLNTYKYENGNWISSKAVYWEDLGVQETFYASILRQKAYNDTMPDDELLSGPVTVNNPNAVNFVLKHAVARVAIRLISSNNTVSPTDLANMEVVLPNYEGLGSYNNGVFDPGTGLVDVEIAKIDGGNGISGLAFIQEQTIAAGTTVAVVTDTRGNSYTVAASSDIFFEAGYNTILEIDIRDTAVLISAQVIDWTEAPTVRMVPAPIPISGDLDANSAFFEGKTIYLYNMDENSKRYDYGYRNGVWSGNENLYWDNYYNDGLDLTAVYYPFSDYIPADLTGQTTFTWDLPADQGTGWDRHDLLMDNQTVAPGVHTYVNFKFKHIMSRVRVKLTSSEFSQTELANATVVLNNFIIDGSADLTNAVAIPASTPAATLIPYKNPDSGNYEAIVMPQSVNKDTQVLTVTLPSYPNSPFDGILEDNLTFTPGYITTIEVKLKLTKVELSADLEEWKENGNGGVTIQ